jgi:formylglycine-generating enzyme required for sulfatase activity
VAATIDRQVAKARLRPGFEALPVDLRTKALAVIRSWRKLLELSPEVWLVEFLNLSDSSRSLVLESDSDLDDARALIRKFDEEFDSQRPVDGLKEYAKRFTRRASNDYAMEDKEVGQILRKFRTLLNPDMEIHAATDPIELPAGDRVSSFGIFADEKLLEIQSENAELSAIRLTQSIASSNAIFEVNVSKSWTEESFWKAGGKPEFVSAFGRDQYGAWFEFQVSGRDTQSVVTQRMRWIRAGTFMMGSPDDEPERRDNEVLHQVTLTRGFWLADTACTQALWAAVMGENQSHFKGDERPVEKVSYDDVVKFCKSLGKQIPGLMPQMPTEAQWEYACRAGTQTPFSFGSTISTDQANFDGSRPYNGAPKGLVRRDTLSVKDLPCNAWGLYQMHGNVWEWCADWYAESLSESQIDPTGSWLGSARVVRGGG